MFARLSADTPGVHLHHRVPHMLSPAELKLLHPRKRLQPLIPPTPLDLTSRASPSPSPPAQDAGAQEDEEEEAPQATNPWEELPPDVTGPGLPKRGKTKRQAAGKVRRFLAANLAVDVRVLNDAAAGRKGLLHAHDACGRGCGRRPGPAACAGPTRGAGWCAWTWWTRHPRPRSPSSGPPRCAWQPPRSTPPSSGRRSPPPQPTAQRPRRRRRRAPPTAAAGRAGRCQRRGRRRRLLSSSCSSSSSGC